MKKMIEIAFNDFDIDMQTFLEKKHFKLMLNLACDRMCVTRCKDWQIEYIMSFFDDNGDGKIYIDDFMNNCSIITYELGKNKPQTKREKQRGDFFHVMFSNNKSDNPEKAEF